MIGVWWGKKVDLIILSQVATVLSAHCSVTLRRTSMCFASFLVVHLNREVHCRLGGHGGQQQS